MVDHPGDPYVHLNPFKRILQRQRTQRYSFSMERIQNAEVLLQIDSLASQQLTFKFLICALLDH